MKITNKFTLISFAIIGLLMGGNANASIIQLGTGAIGQVNGDIAIGDAANARSGIAQGQNSTALGSGCYAMAFGRNANAVCVGAPGLGGSTAIGFAASSNYDAIAVGDQSAALIHGVAVGNRTRAVDSATAIGTNSLAGTIFSTAIGYNSETGGAGGYVAINGRALGYASIAIGGVSTHTSSVAIGDRSTTDRDNQFSVGRPGEERVISNVAFGSQPRDAVVYQQVVPALNGLVSGLGGGATYDPTTGILVAPTFDLGTLGTFNNVYDALLAIRGSGTGTDPLAMRYDDASKSTATLEGAAGTQIKNVADGVDPLDAVNRGQLDTVDGRVSDTRTALASSVSYLGAGAAYDPVSGTMTPPNFEFASGASFTTVEDALLYLETLGGGSGPSGPQGPVGQTGADGRSAYQVAVDDGFVGTQTEWLESLRGANGQDGQDGTGGSEVVAGENISVETNEDGTQTVSLADNIQLSDHGSVEVGATRVDAEGVHIEGGASITTNGVDAGNRRITNVSDGRIEQGSRDAVNGGQIWALQQDFNDRWTTIENRVEGLDKRLSGVCAMGAAQSQAAANASFNTRNSLSFGGGTCGGETAFSGQYVRRVETKRGNLMSFSAGGSTSSSGDTSFGIGIGFGW